MVKNKSNFKGQKPDNIECMYFITFCFLNGFQWGQYESLTVCILAMQLIYLGDEVTLLYS